MDDVRGDFLGPPHGTTPAAVIANKIYLLDPLEAVKTFKERWAILYNIEPSSVTLYKTGSESQTFMIAAISRISK